MTHFLSTITPLLLSAAQENGLHLDATQVEKLTHYLELMQTWNRVFNLTTITKARDMVYLHLIDSLAVKPYLHGTRLLDVGTGAGLPGIPLAIVSPHQQWVLLDKNSKKTRFLTQVIAELQLSQVEVVQQLCEDFHPELRFDSILSRAFGSIRLFVEVTEHLLQPNGVLIAMKGKYPEQELSDLPAHCLVKDVTPLAFKGIDIERHIVRLITRSREMK